MESAKNSELLISLYSELAVETNCYFFDAGSVVISSKKDLEAESHERLAKALKSEINNIFTKSL